MLNIPVTHLPKKVSLLTLLGIVIVISIFIFISSKEMAYAKSCDDIQDLDDRNKCIEDKIENKEEDLEDTRKKLDSIISKKNDISGKIANLSSQLTVTQDEINGIQNDIYALEEEIKLLEQKLAETRDKLQDKITLRNQIVRNYSKKTVLNDLEIFFATFTAGKDLNGFQFSTLAQAFNKAVNEDTINLIGLLNIDIKQYESDKSETEKIKGELEVEQNNLIALKSDLGNRKASAEGELDELGEKESSYKKEIENLKVEIEELNKKQQEILKQKYGDETGTVGEHDTPDHDTPDAPFSPAFAAFSYGAYTHYKGMSQYGAKGRAESGKSYGDIIKFYYDESVKEKDDFPDDICVQGVDDSMDFQKYLYGLAEMPSSWDSDALKAQAVAARSYAYRYAKADKCICTSQSCQVFSKSKSQNPPDAWKKAVDATKDEIIGGSTDASGYGWYSATTGGYIENIGWDVSKNWPKDAYEKKGDSPWFYKAWYTKSYNNNDNCGRSHPWMNQKEMADILNAMVVFEEGSGSDRDHISPVTTSCWGGDPYSIDEMADKADKYGERYNKVSDIDVDTSNNGYTSKITLTTDRGTVSVSGETFKTVFNLRAPSYIAIRSRLYDFEKD